MTEFKGTVKALKRYLGPFLLVTVQQITKKHKAGIGACEHCGTDGILEAAHRHGRTRTDIINMLLGTSEQDALVHINIEEFEEAFRCEHEPVEKAILVLCKECHSKYDANVVESTNGKTEKDSATNSRSSTEKFNEILPISLAPPHPDEFKARLLESREAVIEVYYSNGNVDQKTWNAHRFRETSNIFGNLRSRPEFRQGRWQEMGIVKVHVRVLD